LVKLMVKLLRLYVILYLLVIFTWHPIWAADQRFYLPILPILALWVGRGICRIGGRR